MPEFPDIIVYIEALEQRILGVAKALAPGYLLPRLRRWLSHSG